MARGSLTGPPLPTAPPTALSPGRKRAIQAVCSCSIFMVVMDGTVVNIALPAIRDEFGATLDGLQWTIDAYLVVVASLLVFSGSLADRVGRRRVFRLGLLVFGFGSVLCGLAPSLGLLIAARVVQAVGGSMLNPVAVAIITSVFTEPRERARALGVWSAMSGISLAAGPIVGGLLVDTAGWRYVFLINVPVVAAVFVLTGRLVPESRRPGRRAFDPVGQVLIVVALAAAVYALIEGPRRGFTAPDVLTGAVLAVVAGVALPLVELHRADPLIDFRLFRSAPFSGAIALAVTAFGAYNGFLLLATLYLQDVRGLSALVAGMFLLPVAVVMTLLPPVSAWLINHYGPRPAVAVSGLGLLVGPLVLMALRLDDDLGPLFTGFVLVGIGLGTVNAPILLAAVAGMPKAQAGVAAAIASTARQVGGALGVAIVGGILAHRWRSVDPDTFTIAAVPAWAVVASAGAIALAVGVLTTGRWAMRTAEVARERFLRAAAGDGDDFDAPADPATTRPYV
jgi:EmrB/QacA subfamily drug resistance transporter